MNVAADFRVRGSRAPTQRGFTLVEAMVSAAILVIGLVSMLAVFGLCIAATQDAQADLIARQKASEAMESIFTARNTAQITWDQIQNAASGGIFVDGPQTLRKAGPDGLVGTSDDVADPNPACPGPAECMLEPGPDGIRGTGDDVVLPLNNYTRTIVIAPLLLAGGGTNPYLKQITITVRYQTTQFKSVAKQYVLVAYISQFR
jgi:type II secretory pathway pseudopilin PulG